jgi:hypothetical protein
MRPAYVNTWHNSAMADKATFVTMYADIHSHTANGRNNVDNVSGYSRVFYIFIQKVMNFAAFMKSENHRTLHVNTLMGVVLRNLNPINIFTHCFPNSVEISSSHIRMPSFPQWFRTFGFTDETSVCISCAPKRA